MISNVVVGNCERKKKIIYEGNLYSSQLLFGSNVINFCFLYSSLEKVEFVLPILCAVFFA